ncbi:MAG: hypothetical protein DRG63_08905 [Deltaproteobacteria bacterium]|nr:MAG: hypothetical protein DRG63_08905 [Deltaproteobacteria bacterium]
MSTLELRDVRNYALHGVSLKVASGELVVLLGPNGAGKSTLLNTVAGLIEYEGTIAVDGTPMDNSPPQQREVGYLFQDLVLFPHLDVVSNISYGLRARGWPPNKIKRRVAELLELVRIKDLASCYPWRLSGGEKQRVALARALAPFPKILLLDEPLSSMDLQTAKYLRSEIKRIQRSLGITTLYVTHELQEAEELADRIAVVVEGRIEQIGEPQEVFFDPANNTVLQFLGAPNILECQQVRHLSHGLVEAMCSGMPIVVPEEGSKINRIAILPSDVYISPSKPPGPMVNRFRGVISEIRAFQDIARVCIAVGVNQLWAELPSALFERMGLRKSQEVYIILKLRRIRVDPCMYSALPH